MCKDQQLKGNVDYWVEVLEGQSKAGDDYETLDFILESVLDIEYKVGYDSYKRKIVFRGATLLVAFGGPTITIEVGCNKIEGSHYPDNYSRNYEDNLNLYDYIEGLYHSMM